MVCRLYKGVASHYLAVVRCVDLPVVFHTGVVFILVAMIENYASYCFFCLCVRLHAYVMYQYILVCSAKSVLHLLTR